MAQWSPSSPLAKAVYLALACLVGRIDMARAQWSPSSPLAHAVHLAGFSYDPRQDIIFSRMDALQRKFGYAYGYDDLTNLISAEIDCEPIFFDYNGKTWMIELWKGQYGLMTGCEIGVYNRSHNNSPAYSLLDATIGKRPHDPNLSHSLFFDCARDNELLEMSFVLSRSGQLLFSRGPERHWWLTGFKWGVLSSPDDLEMAGEIKFLDKGMAQKFASAMTTLGHQCALDQARTDVVRFVFRRPRTWQPRLDPARKSVFDQVRAANKNIVEAYQGAHKQLRLRSNDPNLITGDMERRILDYFAQWGQAFFAQAVANLSKQAGRSAQELLDALVNGLRTTYDDAAQAVTHAGYTFSEWISSLESLARTLGLSLDFSCGVQIENWGPTEYSVHTELMREDFGVRFGEYVVKPPEKIAPGAIGRFWMRPNLNGAAGWVVYSCKSLRGDAKFTYRFEYGCPTGLSDNYARAQPTVYSPWVKAGTMTDWLREAKKGHPLRVAFVWGDHARPHDKGGDLPYRASGELIGEPVLPPKPKP